MADASGSAPVAGLVRGGSAFGREAPGAAVSARDPDRVREPRGRAGDARPGGRQVPRLAERYATLERYDAVAHPSLPDYLALVSGSTDGLHTDCTDCVFGARNLADTLAARSLSWKAYVEDLPLRLGDIDRAAVKARIPFLYFRDVLS